MGKMKIYKLIALAIVLIIASTGLWGCFKKNEATQDPPKIEIEKPKDEGIKENESPENQADTQAKESVGVFEGDLAPDFSLLDREGNEIRLSDLRDKVVLIKFWTTWCVYCTYELPYVQEVYEQYKDKDLVVLAVNVLAAEKIEMEEVNRFLDEKGYTFPVLFDVDGQASVQYKVRGLPTTYIIDKNGRIAEFVTGAMEKAVMIEKIENVMNK